MQTEQRLATAQITSNFLLGLLKPQPDLEMMSFLDDTDLESIVMRFAHGECHFWSLALAENHHNVEICGLFIGDEIIHSCLVSDNMYIDARGVHTKESLLESWQFVTGEICEIENISYSELYGLVNPTKEDLEDTHANINYWYSLTQEYFKN